MPCFPRWQTARYYTGWQYDSPPAVVSAADALPSNSTGPIPALRLPTRQADHKADAAGLVQGLNTAAVVLGNQPYNQ